MKIFQFGDLVFGSMSAVTEPRRMLFVYTVPEGDTLVNCLPESHWKVEVYKNEVNFYNEIPLFA
ncbi:hypothetical protein DOLIC_00027 [Dolichomitus sp. PSUC_FEM 10030005]|nr:hypothetical protein [Dolichomitus sp. PSUC_FEM 10030005]